MTALSGGLRIEPMHWSRLDRSFFSGNDVLMLARQLLGMKLQTCIDGRITAGIITETEAYAGESDMASHAYGGRRTKRTETMYLQGGHAYIYLCYGIHSLFNIVTSQPGIPHAVLVRGIIPIEGIRVMQERIGREPDLVRDGAGPGKVARLLGLNCSHNGTDMVEDGQIWVERSDFYLNESIIRATPRIGVDYAGEDAFLPYRFAADHKEALKEIKMAGLV